MDINISLNELFHRALMDLAIEYERSVAAELRVAELEEALKTAIDAIHLLDDYSMGFVCNEDRGIRWPIRDELVDNLRRVLNK